MSMFWGPTVYENKIMELKAEIYRLRDEVALWKDRCEAAEQAHEATIEQCDKMLNEWRQG